MGEKWLFEGGEKEEEGIFPPFSIGGGEEKTVFLSITSRPQEGKGGEDRERRDCLQVQADSVKIEVQRNGKQHIVAKSSSPSPPSQKRKLKLMRCGNAGRAQETDV